MSQEIIQSVLNRWLSRRTQAAGVRRVAALPLAVASDTGVVRKDNQDRCAVILARTSDAKQSVFAAVLCDGMGGMADGARCASLATSAFAASLANPSAEPLFQRLKISAEYANKKVYDAFRGRGGATLSAFALDGRGSRSAINVGDSRIYRFDGEHLHRLTVDDTLKERVPSQQSEWRPGLNDLLQYIGMGDGIEPNGIEVPNAGSSSTLIITSDGTHLVGDDVVGRICAATSDPAHVVQRLAEIAKWFGGPDNASAICIDLTGLDGLLGAREDPASCRIWDPFGEIEIALIPASGPQNARAVASQPQDAEKNVTGKKKRSRAQQKKPPKNSEQSQPVEKDLKVSVDIRKGGAEGNGGDPEKP